MSDEIKQLCRSIWCLLVHYVPISLDCNSMSPQVLKDTVVFLIKLRRKQVQDQCLSCGKRFEGPCSLVPALSWRSLGQLIFKQLLEQPVHQDIQQHVIRMLNAHEISQVKEYLVASIVDRINTRKVIVNNQMLKFITTEINKTDEGYKLTETYLDIFAMNHSELCGNNWGKILTQNMICDVCGAVLIGKRFVSEKREIISFNCGHSFHKFCLQDIGCEYHCFICWRGRFEVAVLEIQSLIYPISTNANSIYLIPWWQRQVL